jgi:hypothetical protein
MCVVFINSINEEKKEKKIFLTKDGIYKQMTLKIFESVYSMLKESNA